MRINKLLIIFALLALAACSDKDDPLEDLFLELEASSETVDYGDTFTLTWSSNASQCYATSSTGSWLGELPPSGSQDFIAKREGTSNYGVQCRKSINFVNASTDVVVSKDFIDYFDFEDAPIYDLGSFSIGDVE